ncbi:MAG: ABC transporter ATP-binding protein [Promethearchaeota archaeon]
MSLRVEKLTKTYPGDFTAIADISLTVNPGECVGLIGPNGAGKTTTLKIIKGILSPTTGNFSINNVSYDRKTNNTELKGLTGFLPEDARVIAYLTVYQYLELVAVLYNVPRALANERIDQFLRLFDLEKRKHWHLEALSEGMKRKVLWVATLIHDPPLVLLDDPLHALDVQSFLNVIELINRLKELKKSILVSTHYLALVEKTCDRIVFISEGRVIKVGTINEILKDTNTPDIYDAYSKIVPSLSSPEDFKRLTL